MKREAKGLHATCFEMAFEVAKKAERALQHELGDPTTTYIDGAYLAGREGLFAGEKLYLDLKRMELAYHELNQREYELTKHVSLLQFAPEALVALRATGKCHSWCRRRCSTSTGQATTSDGSRPSPSASRIVGPYTTIGCKLALLKSQIRRTPAWATTATR